MNQIFTWAESLPVGAQAAGFGEIFGKVKVRASQVTAGSGRPSACA
jgi:hypothetical protein